jgi:hypothetical protein
MHRSFNSLLHLMDVVLGCTAPGIYGHGAIYRGTETEFLICCTGIKEFCNCYKTGRKHSLPYGKTAKQHI